MNMDEPSTPETDIQRRRYDSPARRQKTAETRDRIVAAGADLAHGFDTWDWRELTFRAVAARAGVGERTVYRHFPTERQLHDAVMERLETEAGIHYEDVGLANLSDVTGRVFASLQRFTVRDTMRAPSDPTFVGVDKRRRSALLRSVSEAAPDWSDQQCRATAGLLDALWNLPTYERLVGAWGLTGPAATDAVTWLMDKVLAAIAADDPPQTIA
jgi:AcrR family transcriptional regulator